MLAEAEQACLAALEVASDDVDLYLALSTIHWRAARPHAALRAARMATSLAPSDDVALRNLATSFRGLGLLAPAANWARWALVAVPGHAPTLSQLIFVLNEVGHPATDMAARAYDALMRRPPLPTRQSGGERLRIGFVSSDFRNHVCMTFLLPLLDHLNRRKFKLFAYSHVPVPDATTELVKQRFDVWHDITHLPDEGAARQVQTDCIDVLIDLGGHTTDSRLGIFAYRPARAQASWLGYNGTTGLSAMDWRIVDPWIAPDGISEWFSEKLFHLPRISHCWRPPTDSPDVSESPVRLGHNLTFGSFNNFAKLSGETIAAWIKVLAAVPDARMLLKSRSSGEASVQTSLVRLFAAGGINPARITFLAPTRTQNEHLAAHAAIDIALDAFPYNGTTTTCDALWMGVPVVTLTGSRMLSRITYSLLAGIELEDRLVARTVDEMVAICTGLAADHTGLAKLRREIRPRVEKSPLRDEIGFARAMEKAFMTMARQAGARRRG